MANRRFIDFPVATTVGANDIILIWQDGLNKQTTKATILSGLPEDLEDLADVNISGLTNGQILRYDSTTGKWINTDQANLDLSDLNDVSIVSPSNGQVLVYNSSTSKWENSSAGFVPYTGAVTTVDLGAQQLKAGQTTLATNGSTPTLTVNHTSGSGIGVNITKGGNNEGLKVNKTSGSGNAATIVGTLEATTLVKTGGTSSQFLKADGSVDSTAYVPTSREVIAGAGLAGGGALTSNVTLSHADTSSQASVDNSNGNVIQDITLDTYGHITALGSTNLDSRYYTESEIDATLANYQLLSAKGQPNGYAGLDSNGKVPLAQINDALIGNVNFQGLWNAATNTPTLANPPAAGTKGYYYIVSTAGTFAGISFEVGDWIISDGSAWGKVDNTDAVSSVFGRTGNVTASNGDYNTSQVTENTNLYFTNARAIASVLTGYTSGAGTISAADTILSAIQKLNGNIGALTTGVSSVNGLTGAVTLTTTNIGEGTNLYYTEARVNANANVAANTAARHAAVTLGTANGLSLSTQQLSLGLASAGVTGALSGTDWSTFNSKQNALNGTGFVKISGTTISYDNSTYLTTAAAASTYLPLAGGTMTGVITTPNGTFGIIIGDDSRLADRNIANTLFLEGNQNNDRGYINFSQTTGNALGAVNGGDLTWRGNVVLHAANFNSYAPTLGGTGATGTWSIAITGNAGTANTWTNARTITIGNTGKSVNGSANVAWSLAEIGAYAATNPSAFIALTALSGVAPIQYNNTTGAISITQASGSTNGFLSSTDWNTFNNKTSNVGTVTSVAALTLGTSGTDLSSSVANGTTTPVITLNVPTASASNRGALSAADWTTFNNKQNALTNPVTGTGVAGQVAFWNGTTTQAGSNNLFWDNTNGRLGIGSAIPSAKLEVVGDVHFRALTGNVGFSLISGSDSYSTYFNDADNSLRIYSSIGASDRIILTSSGNLGLGVTPSAWGAFKPSLQVGTASISQIANRAYFTANAFFNGTSWTYIDSDFATQYFQQNGTHIWNTVASGTAGNAISFTQAMTLFATGNLLVGSGSDNGARLQVSGTGRFSGIIIANSAASAANGSINIDNSDPTIRFRRTGGTPNSRIYEWRAVAAGGVNDIMQLRLWNDAESTATTLFTVSPVGAATFSSSVGIGTTPSYRLHVVTDAVAGRQNMSNISRTTANWVRFTNPQYSTDASMGLILRVFPDSDSRQGAGIIASGGNANGVTDLDLFVSSGVASSTSYSALSIKGDTGNVGIGTTSPSGRLHLSSTSDTYLVMTGGASPRTYSFLVDATNLRLFSGVGDTTLLTIASTGAATFSSSVTAGQGIFTGSAAERVRMTRSSVGSWDLAISATNRFSIYDVAGAEERISITSIGNVGIGTTSPDTLLHLSSTTDGSILRLERNSTIITSGQSYGQIQWEGQDASSGAAGVRGSIDVISEGNLGETKMVFRTSGSNANANLERLTINSAGAATFSSSVTAASFIRSGGTSSQYLMADGSVSTLSNPVTGTGTAGQVAYWSSGSAITGESNLFWDATNDRLGIGRNNPSQKLDVLGSGTVYVNIENSNASFAAVITKNTSKTFSTGLVSDYWAVIDATSGSNTRLMITSGGNVLINTVTDVTDARLNVNGNIRTQNPTGGTAANWSLGTARGGTVTTNATVRVMIDGVLVDLVARYV